MSVPLRRHTRHFSPFANPFYLLLVVAGVMFFVTAFAYGVMAVRQLHDSPAVASTDSDRTFVEIMDRHGPGVMVAELIVLSMATVAAIATDGYWSRTAAAVSNLTAHDDADSAVRQQEGSST